MTPGGHSRKGTTRGSLDVMGSETGKVTVSVQVPAGDTVQVPPKGGTPQPELPRTGAEIGTLFNLGMALAIAGLFLTIAARRAHTRKVPMRHIKVTAVL